jgi:hypothetical protein
MNDQTKNITNGKYFPKQIIVLGYLIILFGVIEINTSIFIGLGVVALGLWLAMTKSVLQLDVAKQQMRVAPYLFGFFIARWVSIETYKELTLLGSRINERTYGGMSTQHIDTMDVGYDICLLGPGHRKKLVLDRYDSREKAETIMAEISLYLKKDVVKYNPIISKGTRARR